MLGVPPTLANRPTRANQLRFREPPADQAHLASDRMGPEELAAPLVEVLAAAVGRPRPLVVGIDGRSGAGKSTVASVVARTLADGDRPTAVTVIEGDDFYAGGSAATWDGWSAAERADRCVDWRAQRAVLQSLLAEGTATFRPFDWDADDWDSDDAPHAAEVRVDIAPVVILEGVYSGRPELDDIVGLRVLVDVPDEVRRQQLLGREGDEYRADWEDRWSSAEDHYFGTVMTEDRFDLVLRPGPPVVRAIHIAPATRLPTRRVERVEAEAGLGLVGDRYHGAKHRHVTVQSAVDLAAAGVELGTRVDPADTRRNITISGGTIPTRPGERMRIGDVDLEVVRIAAPCKLLDDAIGAGARHALRRRAGTVFRVLSSGPIAVGDPVDLPA